MPAGRAERGSSHYLGDTELLRAALKAFQGAGAGDRVDQSGAPARDRAD